jgi:PKD domain containing protein
MLKNKLIAKRIRNIFILIMTIAIMMGAYHNVRRSRAEKVIEISLEVADKNNQIEKETVTVEATETSDGVYLLELPEIVNTKVIAQYYNSGNEEINSKTIQLTDKEIEEKKVQVATDYDTKEVEKLEVSGATITVAENAEKKIFYNRKITNETGDIIATGYMPLEAQLETKDIDIGTLTDVKLPNESQSMKKAFTAIITENKTESQNGVSNQAEIQEENANTSQNKAQNEIDTQSQDEAQSESEETKAVYNPSEYGEIVEIQSKYEAENKNEKITVYSLDKQNNIEELQTTETESEETAKTYQFPMNNEVGENETKTYITTAELSEDATIGDETVNDETNIADSSTSYTTSDDTSNGGDFGESSTSPIVGEDLNAAYAGGTSGNDTTLMTTSSETAATSGFFGNSSIQRQNIENVTFTNQLVQDDTPVHRWDASKNTGSSHSSSTTTWKDLNGSMNGTLHGGTWGTDYLQFNGTSDWVGLAAYNPTQQIRIDTWVAPVSIQSGERDIISNFEDGGYGLYLLNGVPTFDIYNASANAWKSAKSSSALTAGQKTHLVATYDGFSVCLYVNDKLVSRVVSEGTIKAPSKSTILAMGANPQGSTVNTQYGFFANIRIYSIAIYDKVYNTSSYDASAATSSYSNTTKIWKDLTGQHDGVVTAGTWGTNYLQFNGTSTWVNMGAIDFTTYASIEATVTINQIQSGERDIVSNFEDGGLGIYLNDGYPKFEAWSTGSNKYVSVQSPNKVTVGTKYTFKGVIRKWKNNTLYKWNFCWFNNIFWANKKTCCGKQ